MLACQDILCKLIRYMPQKGLFFPLLQGWQRKLDPEYDVMNTLQTLLFKADWAESLFYTIEGLMAP